MVAFWTGTPLLAVALAVSWPPRDLEWLSVVLWLVVFVSAVVLTALGRRTLALRFSEWLVYPATLCVAFYLLLFELTPTKQLGELKLEENISISTRFGE